MGILKQLEKQGSTLSKFDGTTPKNSTGKVPLNNLALAKSQLDLDGKTPAKYSDNLPG